MCIIKYKKYLQVANCNHLKDIPQVIIYTRYIIPICLNRLTSLYSKDPNLPVDIKVEQVLFDTHKVTTSASKTE